MTPGEKLYMREKKSRLVEMAKRKGYEVTMNWEKRVLAMILDKEDSKRFQSNWNAIAGK